MKRKNIVPILLGLLLSVLIGMILLLVQGFNPVNVYYSIIKNSLMSWYGITNTLNRMGVLLLVGTSASFALDSGVSNLGQFGQLLVGAIVATVIGIYLKLPRIILIIVILFCSAAAGALYSYIAAVLKRKAGMNEFITTLMLNFIASLVTQYLVGYPLLDPSSNWPMSKVINKNAVLSSINGLDLAVIISVLLFLTIHYILNHTKFGYESKMIGSNKIFAKTGGIEINDKFNKIMLISGALAGVAGALMIIGSSQQNRFLPDIGKSFGDDGLMVAVVSSGQMSLVPIYSLIFSVFKSGATGMQLDTGIPQEFTIMIIAITVLSVVAFNSYYHIFIEKIKMKREIKKIKEDIDGISN